MCHLPPPAVQNVVVNFRLRPSERDRLLDSAEGRELRRSGRNFYVTKVRQHTLVDDWRRGRERERGLLSFTVFPKSGSVIATGVRRPSEVPAALAAFAARLLPGGADDGPSSWRRRVVNSTYVGRITCSNRISTHRALARYKRPGATAKESDVSVSFRSHFFPGGLIKWKGLRGSVNLFNNGRYVIVGAARQSDVRHLHRRLCALMRDSSTTLGPGTSCAWTAGPSSTPC